MTQARDVADGKFTNNVLTVSSADNIVGSFESTDAVQWIAMQDSDTSSSTHVMLGAIGDDLRFRAGNNEVGRWLSGGGLAFNGDTTQANALDDYEEGTWTPTVTTSTSVDISSGGLGATYTKIGRMVNVQAYMSWSNNQNNNSSQFFIGGLPFTVGYHYGGWTIVYVGSANMNDALGVFNVSDTKMYFHQNDGNSAPLTNSDITSRSFTTLILSGTYLDLLLVLFRWTVRD